MINRLFKLALNNIPRPWLIRLSYGVQAVAPIFLKGDTFIDPIDGRGYRKFFPYGYGEHQRENALSPGTNSLERHRLLWLYLKEETNFLTEPQKVLHIAPEQCFYGRFKKLKNLDYTTADLNSPLADLSFDVQEIPLPSDTYDVILCNHVLEHVPNDIKAMREIHRILKPGGWAIMQVPLNPAWEKTLEDPTITDPEERHRLFGQYDHVRMYGQDYPERLLQAGFSVTAIDYSQKIPKELFAKYALPVGEILYVAVKI
jgi:SAM-dependent methyltransferase